MPLPQQIARQAEEADRIVQGLNPQPATEPEPEKPAETPAEQPTKAASEGEQPTQSENPTESEQKPRSKPKAFEKDDEETWKQRYLSFQGNHRAVVGTLQQQLAQLTEQLGRANTKLEALESANSTTERATPAPQSRITDKDVEAFGSDLIDVIDRKAQEVAETMTRELRAKVGQLEGALAKANSQLGTVSETQATTEKERFFSGLTGKVSNWEAVQGTEECQEWLGTRVPGTRATWDDALKHAASRHDVESAAEIFQTFFKEYPQFDPAAKAASRTETRQELQRQVAPVRSSATPAPSQQQGKRIYSTAEYESESRRLISLMKNPGKQDDAAALERELDAAIHEGRIRP